MLLAVDIKHFKLINDKYGFAVGDIVLSKATERVKKILTEEMLMFRIGKDSFVVLTGYYEKK